MKTGYDMSKNFKRVNTYAISREWFDWSFEHPDIVKPPHSAIYFYAIDQNNRFGWKEKFGLPTLQAMEATGIKSKNTYYKAFNNLIEWNFIKIITKAKNANSANIISIPAVLKFNSVDNTVKSSVLDLVNIQQEDSRGNIDKQINKETINKEQGTGNRAFDFLKTHYPSRFETDFQMKYEKQIKKKEKFVEDFNDTVEQEKLQFDSALFGRLGKYSRNWIENQDRYKPKTEEKANEVDQFYSNIPKE